MLRNDRIRRRIFICAIGVIWAVTVLALAPGGSSLGAARSAMLGQSFPSPTADPADPGPPPAQLTTAQRDQANRVATSDSLVSSLIAGRSVTIRDTVGWWTKDESRNIGAVVFLKLPTLASISATLPYVLYDPTESTFPPYSQHSTLLIASNVSELWVWVDLNSNRVVSIHPDPDDLPIYPTPAQQPPATSPAPVDVNPLLVDQPFAVTNAVWFCETYVSPFQPACPSPPVPLPF